MNAWGREVQAAGGPIGPVSVQDRHERRRLAIPSVLVNGHQFLWSPADTVATYRVH